MKTFKNLFLLSLLSLLILSAFKINKTASQRKYAYVTYLEHTLDEDDNRMINCYSTVFEVPCNLSDDAIKYQFIEYYNAEIASKKVEIVNRTTSAWQYDTYDKAVAKRREDMAKQNGEKKTIHTFSVTCED